jgi:CRP-like cAMP-binding protein
MPGLNRKVRITADWLLHLLFPPELAQTKVAFEPGIRNQHFEPGDMIFYQGDLGDSVYVIEEGECEALRMQKDQPELLATLGRGGYFGEMALLTDRTRNATIRARTVMNILIIPKTDFDKLHQSVAIFGEVFTELVKQRAAASSLPSTI